MSNLEHVDLAIGRTSKEGVTVSRPGERDNPRQTTLDWARSLDLLKNVLVLQVPDLNGSLSSSAEPVVLGREGKGTDGAASLEGVEVLALVDIPEHSGTVLTTRSAERTVRGDGDIVDDTSVTREVSAELEVVKVPDLNELVPASRNDKRLLGGGREANTGDPVGVLVISEGVLAFTHGVPELDGAITTSGNDLSVVSGEGDGEDITSVTDKGADRRASSQVPQAEGLVPRGRKGELAIRRDTDVLDSLVVTSESSLSEANVLGLRGEVPDHKLLITRAGHDDVTRLNSSSDGSDPVAVTL